ncbi:hypothetical protein ZWY2020_011966 [Hordeum vulgare]|nr:hypothetical protein ZWY2020_011966 [Hordeum vulgare]
MADSSRCTLCGMQDSWRHTLLNCTMSRSIWSLADENLVQQLSLNQDCNARKWIFAMQDHLSKREFLCFLVTLWAIWRARRKAIYEHIFHSPLSTHHFINSYLADLEAVEKLGILAPTVRTPTHRPRGWQQPSASLSKINADAAMSRNQRSGTVATVCRSHEGLFLGASIIVFGGTHDPPTLEALAVREALALAKDLNLQEIHVASDCKVVVDDIKQQNRATYGAIIHEIIEYGSFISCIFVHEFRSLNLEAHNLAKHALRLGISRHVWLGHRRNLFFVPVNLVTVE